eukprot:TRINITY_DN1980_c0_g1_i1.p1 TRINITY_DN1980_c0_g1~~TRINITY_DN1980_c0_g1_i1.p1  ORF type:complete len:225 (+),score=23.33 TRINITY_DN1980_c0_g1_i1:797-1471(+)
MRIVLRDTGIVDVDALIAKLVLVVDSYSNFVAQSEQQRESDRAARLLRHQQDQEYHEALEKDRERRRKEEEEKEEVRRLAEEKQRQHELEEKERHRELEEQKLREEMRAKKRQSLPPEPPTNETAITVALCLPDGSKLTRRFPTDTLMKTVFDFTESHELMTNERIDEKYKLVTRFPRQVFHPEEHGDTPLRELGRNCLLLVEVEHESDEDEDEDEDDDDNEEE